MSDLKILFPETSFMISLREKRLYEVPEDDWDKKIDWSDRVIDWDRFSKIIRPRYESTWEKIILDFDPKGVLVLYNYEKGFSLSVRANLLIKNFSLKMKEKDDEEPTKNLLAEEILPDIRKLEREKDRLEQEIKKSEKQEKFKEMAEETALIMNAFVNAGFSRPEAMQLIISGVLMQTLNHH